MSGVARRPSLARVPGVAHPCSRKISTVDIHDQGGQENLSDVQRKSLLDILRPEAVSGTPLLEQEFALREATVGKRLEIRIDSYTDRMKERIYS